MTTGFFENKIIIPDRPGFSLKWDIKSRLFHLIAPDGVLLLFPFFLDPAESEHIFKKILENNEGLNPEQISQSNTDSDFLSNIRFTQIHWEQLHLRLFRKKIPQPRLTAWYADKGINYAYSGLKLQARPFPPLLEILRKKVESVSGMPFNSVLLNWYRNGSDYISWHSDDEKKLGKNPVIASLSLGAIRTFQLRRKDDYTCKISIPMTSGSLLIMSGALQHFWQHGIPKERKIEAGRINLTFRKIINM